MKGQGWYGNPEGHAIAGAKGAANLLKKRGRKHMAAIGSKGGTTVSSDKVHMSDIGKLGRSRQCRLVTDSESRRMKVLRVEEGYLLREIAEIFGVHPSTVWQHCRKGTS